MTDFYNHYEDVTPTKVWPLKTSYEKITQRNLAGQYEGTTTIGQVKSFAIIITTVIILLAIALFLIWGMPLMLDYFMNTPTPASWEWIIFEW